MDDTNPTMKKQLTIRLCGPRGFCAGVDRAIQIVVLALKKYGAPVYVRHEIVHNRYVVEGLQSKGAVFVEELSEIPDTEAPVVFSAHGVPKSVPADARTRIEANVAPALALEAMLVSAIRRDPAGAR